MTPYAYWVQLLKYFPVFLTSEVLGHGVGSDWSEYHCELLLGRKKGCLFCCVGQPPRFHSCLLSRVSGAGRLFMYRNCGEHAGKERHSDLFFSVAQKYLEASVLVLPLWCGDLSAYFWAANVKKKFGKSWRNACLTGLPEWLHFGPQTSQISDFHATEIN